MVNSDGGINEFWLKALLNHQIGERINEKDRHILGYLTNIQVQNHSKEIDLGYDIIFTFE